MHDARHITLVLLRRLWPGMVDFVPEGDSIGQIKGGYRTAGYVAAVVEETIRLPISPSVVGFINEQLFELF